MKYLKYKQKYLELTKNLSDNNCYETFNNIEECIYISNNLEKSTVLSKKYVNTVFPVELAFLQGLLLLDSTLYRSSGLYGKSFIQMLNYPSLNLVKHMQLPPIIFSEDITFFNNKIYMLTYKENKLLEWDLMLNNYIEYYYPREGWGICHDGENHFWTTDGSCYLYSWSDPSNPLKDLKKIIVHHKKNNNEHVPVNNLNAMEWFPTGTISNKPLILVFEWMTPNLHAVNPYSGEIIHTFNLQELYPESSNDNHEYCPNGITRFHSKNNSNNLDSSFLITGKGWNIIYKLNLKIK